MVLRRIQRRRRKGQGQGAWGSGGRKLEACPKVERTYQRHQGREGCVSHRVLAQGACLGVHPPLQYSVLRTLRRRLGSDGVRYVPTRQPQAQRGTRKTLAEVLPEMACRRNCKLAQVEGRSTQGRPAEISVKVPDSRIVLALVDD